MLAVAASHGASMVSTTTFVNVLRVGLVAVCLRSATRSTSAMEWTAAEVRVVKTALRSTRASAPRDGDREVKTNHVQTLAGVAAVLDKWAARAHAGAEAVTTASPNGRKTNCLGTTLVPCPNRLSSSSTI